MNIFNSLGSNYNLQYVVNSIYQDDKNKKKKLIEGLKLAYSGEVELFYKGRTAITRALIESSITPKSGVAITGFTCIAVVDAIKKAGMTPIFIDIDETLNFSAKSLEKKVTSENIKAVIIQNTLGFPCKIDQILAVCKKHKLVLIEDLAHSIGCTYDQKNEAGTVGDFVILSFSQDKVIDAVSGGALIRRKKLTTSPKPAATKNSDASFQDRFYPLFTYGIRKLYAVKLGKLLHVFLKSTHMLSNPMKNDSFKTLSDWHAGIVISEFLDVEKSVHHRRKISHIYAKEIKNSMTESALITQIDQAVCLRFPLFVEKRDNLIKFLKSHGVYVSDIWYDSPVSPKKYLMHSGYTNGLCPQSELISKKILNLPTHKNVTEEDAKAISHLINTWHTAQK